MHKQLAGSHFIKVDWLGDESKVSILVFRQLTAAVMTANSQ